jgi:hypothetical protein
VHSDDPGLIRALWGALQAAAAAAAEPPPIGSARTPPASPPPSALVAPLALALAFAATGVSGL